MKKNRTSICMLCAIGILTACLLSGCSATEFFNDPLPQKVTIEKKEETQTTATPAPTATPLPTVTPGANNSSASGNGSAQENNAPALYAIDATDAEDTTISASTRKKVVDAANHRLDTGYYSRESLIAGLMQDGFSEAEAEYGVDHCYVDF